MSDQQLEQGSASAQAIEPDDFMKLLEKDFKPRTDQAKDRVESAVKTLALQALEGSITVSDDVFATIDKIKAALDQKLTSQINQILHNADFQKIESSWRGLWYLVSNTPTDTDLKIKVMNISRDELHRTLRTFNAQSGQMSWDQSPIFKRIYEAEFGTLGGNPYGAIVADFEFDHSPRDVEMLTRLGRIGAASHAPVITGTRPSLFGLDKWEDLSKPADLAKIFDTVDYQEWKALRQSEDSRYITLAMPRILGRRPYGAASEQVENFAFEEDVSGGDSSKFQWINAAYAMALNVNLAFKEYGWCASIRGVQSGGLVEDLPIARFETADGQIDVKCPTEVSITDRREAELSKAGLLPIVHQKNTNTGAFIGAQTLNMPRQYDDKDATANANLSSRLPYIFTACRFAHYLKVIVRNNIGKMTTGEKLQQELQQWVNQYVHSNPSEGSDDALARAPLSAASVDVIADEENPGYYRGIFKFKPHYQLEGMDVSLSMVSRLEKS
jgi:type VI secretion system protein ImpC